MKCWLFTLASLVISAALDGCSGLGGSGVPATTGGALGDRATLTHAFQVLHTFEDGRDGADPAAGLLLVNGTAYGTTRSGGIRKYAVYNPAGTIFKIGAGGRYAVLYRFAPHIPFGQRAYPDGGLVTDSAGDFYGTTNEGGPNHLGTVYERTARGRVTTLYTFKGGVADGEFPYASVLRNSAGDLYGTTEAGGGTGCNYAGCGTVFEVDRKNHESVLYAFAGGTDGCVPYGGVVRDRWGNLYGTTTECGSASCPIGYSCGIVFKIDPHGHETILHRFTDFAGGLGPDDSLLLGSDGTLYGTAEAGGSFDADGGLVFKVDKYGHETALHTFSGGSDGASPFGGLIQDAAGNLYGTTSNGGGHACNDGNGCGTLFELDPAGKETVLYRFRGKQDGMDPMASLAIDSSGYLYGTTEYGGDDRCNNGLGCGVAFKFKP